MMQKSFEEKTSHLMFDASFIDKPTKYTRHTHALSISTTTSHDINNTG
jgi:hypothetical protein